MLVYTTLENDIGMARQVLRWQNWLLSSQVAKQAITCLESNWFNLADIASDTRINESILHTINNQWENEVFYIVN